MVLAPVGIFLSSIEADGSRQNSIITTITDIILIDSPSYIFISWK